MAIIEIYRQEGPGYNPFLVRDGWQVAQLNHLPEQDLYGIVKMDRHLLTDEAFILLKGSAVLIAGTEQGGAFVFEGNKMKMGVTYNIPVKQWHNIAMDKGAELIIVEKDHTHKGDYEFRQLTVPEKQALDTLITTLLNENDK
jgi:ureidoglycolate hydrolase